jgi:uncharacterized GH25 family protein
MRFRSVALALLVAAGSNTVASRAWSHEFWLSPSRYRAAARDTVEISAFIGTGFRGDLKPYAATRVLHFQLRMAQVVDVAHLARNGDAIMARFVAPDAGGALAAYEGNFADIELPAEEFDRYLRLEGLDEPLQARAAVATPQIGRERYARCGKTWIAGRDPGRLFAPVGLTFELVPIADPSRSDTIAVRALFRGKPLAGTLVRAWRRPLARTGRPFDPAKRDSVPPVAEVRTNADGLATIPARGAGEWLLSTVHMIPSADVKEADWESYWASLTFARDRK